MPLLARVLCECGDDKLIPPIVWQNLHPLLEDRGEQFLRLLAKADARDTRRFGLLLPRVIERLLAARKPNLPAICELVALLGEGPNADADCCCKCLGLLSTKVQTGEITGKQREALAVQIVPTLTKIRTGKTGSPLYTDSVVLAATLGEPAAIQAARKILAGREPGGAGPHQGPGRVGGPQGRLAFRARCRGARRTLRLPDFPRAGASCSRWIRSPQGGRPRARTLFQNGPRSSGEVNRAADPACDLGQAAPGRDRQEEGFDQRA